LLEVVALLLTAELLVAVAFLVIEVLLLSVEPRPEITISLLLAQP